MKVSLFITCLGDCFYPDVGKDTVHVLERFGCEVDFPLAQTCCGQVAYNSGYHKEAKEAAKHMIHTFAHADYVVAPSGSCAAMFHEYEQLFQEEEWKEKARVLAVKTYELTQFLVEVLQVKEVGAELNAKAVYHQSCHMARLLKVKDAPLTLLRQVKGLEVVPFADADVCCGFGGTFAVKMAPIAEQMVEEKVQHMVDTDAAIVIGSDSGCLLNIGGWINRQGKPMQVVHIAQVLNSR
ncbi:(Fe-S)-binding protein [Desmospora activa]|uniref:L-lactate dehydrogenase complex protein LldE n=1 Tax=Desmospora activa DSM 45169 TaxID=1121389 RepID=A0A2T4ZCZ0_9BACL|nr:(Fe-S)-binding protein [Desmospora activa]PTM59753.1 L-lactate dehydrogenase complex protein LldE [Desmospora activa DSM 45169]